MKKLICVLFLFLGLNSYSQCVINSTNGYTVTVNLSITEIIVHTNTCPSGYNFDYRINYSIVFTGSNIPSNMYTLQGNVYSGGHPANFFDLPNTQGTGNIISQGNSWTSNTNCNTVNTSNFSSSLLELIIEGPGISYRTLICPQTSLNLVFDQYPTIKQEKGHYVEFIPNPTDKIKIQGRLENEDVIVSVYDIQMKKVSTHILSPENGILNSEINVGLANGIYFVEVKQKNFFQIHKLIIQN